MNIEKEFERISEYFSPKVISEVNDVFVKIAKIKGDYFVVKKGIKHKISAKEECKIMLIENKTTAHTGEIKSEVTKSIEDQLK